MRITDFLERPKSRELLGDWYASALEDQQQSGMSVAEYADEIGVSAGTLYEWRRRLSGQRGSTDPDASRRLIEVTLERAVGQDTSAGFTLRLGRDRSIEVPPNFDDTELMRLVATIESC